MPFTLLAAPICSTSSSTSIVSNLLLLQMMKLRASWLDRSDSRLWVVHRTLHGTCLSTCWQLQSKQQQQRQMGQQIAVAACHDTERIMNEKVGPGTLANPCCMQLAVQVVKSSKLWQQRQEDCVSRLLLLQLRALQTSRPCRPDPCLDPGLWPVIKDCKQPPTQRVDHSCPPFECLAWPADCPRCILSR